MKKLFIVSALSVFLIACATVTKPGNYNVVKQDVISGSFDDNWNKIIEWFAENNIAIESLEKESGIISAKSTTVDTSFFDCGSASYTKDFNLSAKFNAFAKQEGSATRVRFTLDGSAQRCNINGYGQCVGATINITCNSKGELEKSFYNYIKQ